ncbi:sigma factor-like helix-turn-helix DNA-binding protein [Chthoniobacter flavus]|uniref:sigma factor-like helix-turn-helix DNA-binding protein n=1 Tax=Chthoniobacter flavus TaxID=191863 RepID=UPI0005B2E33E|nr:sigma factor-like helix-turn-helix DNA-binding protein [Chthoniobacter flavus]
MRVSKEGAAYIDLGLAILGAVTEPGQCRTHEEIAAYCGCTKQAISQIEWRAIRKLRKIAQGNPQHPLWDVLAEVDRLNGLQGAWDGV